jgi:phosphoglycerate dehydrogenase-like enzyme
MPSHRPPRVAIAPTISDEWIAEAVTAGGGHVVALPEAEAVVWTDPSDAFGLEEVLDEYPDLRWVQLLWAGVEPFVDLIDDKRTWTCGKGVYSEPVAELALTLALAGMRGISTYTRQAQWVEQLGRPLIGARVAVLGGGGITEALIRLLQPFDCHITVVRNRVREMEGADEVLEADRYVDALPGADLVVLALPLTPDTEGIIGRSELESMERHAWLVNVARGKHVVTDELVWALENDVIGGAALDVTDPEPLPVGHPLWTLPNCIVTPHVGSTPSMSKPLLFARISENVKRFAHDEELSGSVDPNLGY